MERPMLRPWVILLALAALITVGCGAGATPTPTAAPPATPAAPTATPTSVPPATPTPPATSPVGSPTAGTMPSPTTATTPSASALAFRLVPGQSEARYRVREQLFGRSLPNDAVGTTQAVEGQIVFRPDGTIDPEASRFTVDLTTLRSDESRRDNYIKQNTLEVAKYPTAEFRPTAATGLPWPLPTSGQATFQLVGDLTVHGVTKPVTWNVQVTFEDARLTGTATTQVTFQDFGMTPPRVPIVLSLEETITLELDFAVEPAS